MNFSTELINRAKKHFLKKEGVYLTDEKASEYLFALGSLGLVIIRVAGADKKDGILGTSDSEYEQLTPSRTVIAKNHGLARGKVEVRAAGEGGTRSVAQCPQNAMTNRRKKKK